MCPTGLSCIVRAMDTLPRPARGDEVRPEHGPSNSRAVLGKLITIISGLILAWMAIAAAGGLMICSSSIASPDCVDEFSASVLSAFIVFVIGALALAIRSTELALRLVAISSFATAGILLFILAQWDAEAAVLIPAAPLSLGIGSALRLSARR